MNSDNTSQSNQYTMTLEDLRKLQTTTEASTLSPTPSSPTDTLLANPQATCPCCGYCPACGRSNQTWPWNAFPYPYPSPFIWYSGTSTISTPEPHVTVTVSHTPVDEWGI